MRTLLTIALTILVVGLLAVGFVWSGTYSIGADDPHSRPVHALLETMRERSIEARSADISAPDLTSAELIRSGAGNYDAMCTGCHLAPGMNESELSKGLYPAPPNLSKAPIDDPAEAFWVIKHGIKASGMPAWGKSMTDEYLWGMVAFLRQLPELDPEEYQQAVAASEGHSHGGGESAGPTAAGDHAHDGGPDDHGATESPPPAAVHTHADGKQHVHATAAGSPVDTGKALHEALSSADASKVKVLLDPKVLILESGGAERSWAEYAAHHLKADMDFLKTVTYKLQRQTGDTVGDLAWVASEARMTGKSKDKPVDIQSTETLVLKKAAAGWKVVHIHWSSRPVRQ
jgi:mono/diheme cytochrome c family protein/ketosteroid isomerase-like protein